VKSLAPHISIPKLDEFSDAGGIIARTVLQEETHEIP